jgi:hypothetical protein
MAETAASLTLAPLAELAELLEAAGLRVTTDPAELVPPGVLIGLSGFTVLTLDGIYAPTALVRVVVPDSPQDKAAAELVELTNRLLELLEPDGPITALGLILPNDPAPLPCLSFPVNLS